MNLLLVEDDPELARQLRKWLSQRGHAVAWLERSDDGLKAAMTHPFDVVMLDVTLPGANGFEIVEKMRSRNERVPVLFLTAKSSVADRVTGLSAGGDDYLTKPFAMEELLARLEALYRRSTQASTVQRRIGEWVLDTRQRRLCHGNEIIDLQPKECTLLEMLIENTGRVLSKKFLLDKVWNIRFDPGTNVVDSMVCRLRRKMSVSGHSATIETVRGQGYAFKPSA